MNLTAINVTRTDARAAFLEYRGAVMQALDQEAETYDPRRLEIIRRQREADQAIMEGYRQLKHGRTVIDLATAIGAGGEDERHRPRLAIARADLSGVSMTRRQNGSVRFWGGTRRSDAADPRGALEHDLPAGTLPALPDTALGRWGAVSAEAIAPMIPPRFRPAVTQLHRYHLLWEADWKAIPVDPALLRALGGGLFQVLATWDLTDLERLVLTNRQA